MKNIALYILSFILVFVLPLIFILFIYMLDAKSALKEYSAISRCKLIIVYSVSALFFSIILLYISSLTSTASSSNTLVSISYLVMYNLYSLILVSALVLIITIFAVIYLKAMK